MGLVRSPSPCVSARGAIVAGMFANLLQLITGRPPPPEVERNAFVEEVRVTGPVRGSR